jgi:hypothetical protein
VTERAIGTGTLTVRLAEPLIVPDDAEIVVVPELSAVAIPVELMLATEGAEEFHETDWVRF